MSTVDAGVVRPDPQDSEELAAIRAQFDALSAEGYRPVLMGPDGKHQELPENIYNVLRLIVDALAEGHTVTVLPDDRQLTTQQAADILRVSRPHLIKLLERGEIPFDRTGTHRRVRAQDVLEYRRKRSAERQEQLRNLTQLSQDVEGHYS
jgi:excisionase family DNA binding protein